MSKSFYFHSSVYDHLLVSCRGLSVDQVKIQQYSRQRNAYASFESSCRSDLMQPLIYLNSFRMAKIETVGARLEIFIYTFCFLCVRPIRPPEVTANDQGKH